MKFISYIFICAIGLLCLMYTPVQAQVENEFSKLRDLAFELEDANKLDSALSLYQQAAIVAVETENNFDKITIYTDLAIVNRKLANYVACKNFHQKALELAKNVNDKEMVEISYHGLGTLYEQIGDYEKAIISYLEALRLTRARGDKEGVIVTLQNISKTYMQFNFKELALQNIVQAVQLTQQLKNDSLMANVLHDEGEILAHFGSLDSAVVSLQKALHTYEILGHHRFIGSTLVYLGDTYAKLNDQKATLEYFERAMQYEADMDLFVVADLYLKLGKLRMSKGNKQLANQYFNKSLAIAQKNSFKDLVQKTSWELYDYNRMNGDIQTALSYLNTASSLRDSIYNVGSAKRIAELQLKYDNERQQRELQALRLNQNQLLLGFFILFFVVLIGFLIYFTRMTNRNNGALRVKNDEIMQQNLKLTESNELLRQYAYVAAHDLKEPLRTICSFVNLIEIKFSKQIDDPQAKEYMQFISNSAKRMNLLLSDLLEYSSVFHQKPGHESVNPKEVLHDVTFNLRTLIDSKNAKVVFEETSFPHININRLHLMQIFQNLVGNAMKFTQNRSSRVEISYTMDAKEVIFAVKDNGVGISEKHREKIFQLFFRAFTEKEVEGTGIGLSICKSLTEKYGGRIWFHSVEGQGATFFFTVPRALVVNQEVLLAKIAG